MRLWAVGCLQQQKLGNNPNVQLGAWLNKERPIHKAEHNGERMRKLSVQKWKDLKDTGSEKASTEQYVFYAGGHNMYLCFLVST